MAARELLRRQDAKEALIAFTEYTFPRYRTAGHHRAIAEQLERVERGEVDRLMLLLPPRHGKSELASKRFPGWLLGRRPHMQFLSVSATADLAGDFGRDVRNMIGSPEYRAIFDLLLSEDSKAKGKWHTSDGGVYYSVGVDGNILGRGGDVMLIDDPFATMEDAQSERIRERVWDWYTGTAYNRLQPGGAIVLINHRMHEADLSGRLLDQQAAGGDRWEVVEFPAISDSGEALWPERYPLDALERIRANTLPRFWSALYQQRPTPDEGTYFQRDWFNWYKPHELTAHVRKYGASDYAVTAGGGDWTVHVVAAVDPDDNLYIVDLWRAQTSADEWIEAFLDLVSAHRPLIWAEERGQILKSLDPYINKRMRERRTYCRREQFPVTADKPTRAQSFIARCASGRVHLPEGRPWVPDLLGELLAFDAGANDDQVDALGLIGRLLDQMAPGITPGRHDKTRDRWDRAFERDENEGDTWRTT